ncbi:17-beta-hydroxysteroid dehydrogenase 14-like [Bradysia coprophila]|uniref:17-beta-hydroxysteroid dehydrogenase 14-like n=1 Tax=Bradysia coprophila TaxID=38358 RepID=UPI00187D7B43|nr:17-beta-hydroxysteroid dehydrogenase 14-like [Bradysia coprophila]
MSFLNKVVIVTGASSGIGADVVKRFANEAAKVVLVGRNEANLNKVRNELPANVEALNIIADITKHEDSVINKTIERFGQIDILINNAGVLQKGSVEDIEISDFDDLMDVNVRSVFKLTKRAIPHLIKTKGNIVNVSSITGLRSFPNAISYCVSKAALDQFTRCTALDLASKGIRVNSVNPGTIGTGMHKKLGMTDEDFAAFLEKCKLTHAMGRHGDTSEVSSAILFLAGDTASFITGCCLPVDGGKHAMCS